MRRKQFLGAMALMAAGASVISAPAFADRYDGYYASDGHYYYRGDNGRYYQGEPVYRGRSHYYRHRCSGGNGAVGTIGGGVGGALIGNALGGTAGTVIGGVGGALLGRHLDKENTRDRNGC